MSQVVLVALNFLNGHSFASSLIQEEEVSEHRISQVFGLLLLFNIVLATAQFIAAPFVADYYNQPIIIDMLHVQMLIYLITPFISLPIVLLARQLNFKAQAKADMAGAVVGATTALTGAYLGAGVWTLVVAPMMQQATRAIGLTLAAGHLTRPSFNFKGAGSVLTFGSALVACQFFWVVQSQADVVIAGPQFDPHHLGLYTEALFLTLIFTAKFIPPLNEVAFPAYTQLAKEGGDVGKAFVATARMLMFAATPLYLGMSVVAGPLVDTLFGPKWHEMVPLVAGLPLAMPFFALQIICSPTTNALGRPKIYLKSSVWGAVIMVSCFWIGSRWGAQGLVHAWQVGAPTLLLVTLALTLPAIKVRSLDLLRAIAPSVAASVAMAGIVGYTERHIAGIPPVAELGILALLGVTIYVGLIWVFARALIEDLFRFVTKRELGRTAAQTPTSQAV
jgi:O-antigen/teichoic acid export membrane protein